MNLVGAAEGLPSSWTLVSYRLKLLHPLSVEALLSWESTVRNLLWQVTIRLWLFLLGLCRRSPRGGAR